MQRAALPQEGKMKIPGLKKFVAQVKPTNQGRLKWQFELRISLEALEEDGMLQMIIHRSAARIARGQIDAGVWPASGKIVVWYAEMDEDMDIPINEVNWHPLMES